MGNSSRFWLICLFATVLLTANIDSASAYIYWGDINTNRIGRANLDGTGINTTFVTTATSAPHQLASSGTNVFWANQNSSSIGRANADGSSAAQIVTGAATAQGVAVGTSNLFWTTASGANIRRGGLDGSSATTIVGSAGSAFNVAVSDTHVYWSRPGNNVIARANLDGTSPNTTFIAGNAPFGVAVYGDYIYWVNSGSDSIGRANLDGTNSNPTFITGIRGGAMALAVDAEHLYWTNWPIGDIGRVNLDGTGLNIAFISTSGSSRAVAVDPPLFDAAPTNKDFGEVAISSNSTSQDIVISNNGGGPLVVPTVSLAGGDAGEFSITGNTCSSNLDPAETCTVTVRFSPTSAGGKSANLKFDYLSGPYGTATTTNVALSGTGAAPPVPDDPITADPEPEPGPLVIQRIPLMNITFDYFTPTRDAQNERERGMGTTFYYELPEAATMSMSFKRAGLKAGSNEARRSRGSMAVIPTPLTWSAEAGRGSYYFNGWIKDIRSGASRRLTTGLWKVTINATYTGGLVDVGTKRVWMRVFDDKSKRRRTVKR